MGRGLIHANAALLVMVLLAGCIRSPERAPGTAVSWGATAQRTGEAWLAGEVPSAYARRTARLAHRALSTQRDLLRDVEEDPDGVAERVAALTRSVRRLEAGLLEADRDSVARAVGEVAALTETIEP